MRDDQWADYTERLDNSGPAVEFSAEQLRDMGWEVRVRRNTRAKCKEDRHNHYDQGDTIIRREALGGPWNRCEVKQQFTSGRHWTCLEDWPFPGRFFVVSVKRHDDPMRMVRQPTFMYIHPNDDLTAFSYHFPAFWGDGRWDEDIYNRRRGEWDRLVFIRPEMVEFRQVR